MFVLDPLSRTPLYEQIVKEAERLIVTGTLRPGEKLYSVRSLSVELSINPNTILKAYGELESGGIIYSVPAKGYYIAEDAKEKLGKKFEKLIFPMKNTVMKMALAGVPEEKVIFAVKEAYAAAGNLKGGDNND